MAAHQPKAKVARNDRELSSLRPDLTEVAVVAEETRSRPGAGHHQPGEEVVRRDRRSVGGRPRHEADRHDTQNEDETEGDQVAGSAQGFPEELANP